VTTSMTKQWTSHVMVEPRPNRERRSSAIAYGTAARTAGVFLGDTTGFDATGVAIDAARNVPGVPLPTG